MNPWTLYFSFMTIPLSSRFNKWVTGKLTKHEVECVLCFIVGIGTELDGLHVVNILFKLLEAMLLLHGLLDGPNEAILKSVHTHTTQHRSHTKVLCRIRHNCWLFRFVPHFKGIVCRWDSMK